jgi:hypothetical protein
MLSAHTHEVTWRRIVRVSEVYVKFRDEGMNSLVPTAEQVQQEDKRVALRQGQRRRAKDRKAAKKNSI